MHAGRDRPENETGVSPTKRAPNFLSIRPMTTDESARLSDVIYSAVLAELEECFGGPSGHLGQELLESERRWIARGIVARVFLGSSPQLDWQG